MNRPTRATDLLASFGVVGVIGYLLLAVGYSSLPPLDWFIPVPVAALAVAEFVIARRVRLAVRHRPGAKLMTALAVARSVALGKASALVAAAVVGAAVAMLATVLPDANRTDAAQHDLLISAIMVVAAGALTAAGLLLERAGLDPNRP